MIRVIVGDALTTLKKLPSCSVHCCITSPPYWGLRDYGTSKWLGGDSACSHLTSNQVQDSKAPGAITSGVRPGADNSRCLKCGAIREDLQIGLEPTPESYTRKLVEVFREVRRVLIENGTLWLNLGDSYNARPAQRKTTDKCGAKQNSNRGSNSVGSRSTPSLKPKDLVGIPWRVAFALQADGWYLRSDIIWEKPNVMPESVADRPTKSHEYLFLLSKQSNYYFDKESIKEMNTDGTGLRSRRSVWHINTQPCKEAHFATFPLELPTLCLLAGCPVGGTVLDPFSGASTTGYAAALNGREFIGIELNREYADIERCLTIPDNETQ